MKMIIYKFKIIILLSALVFFINNTLYSFADSINRANPDMVMDNSGDSVYVVWQEDSAGGIWFSQSTDKGESFGSDTNISDGVTGTNINPAIAVDNHDNVYIVWQNEDATGNLDLYFARKLEGESTFQTAVIPIDDSLGISDQVQPAIDGHNSGDVFIAWINQNTPNGVYYAKSEDRGASLWALGSGEIHEVDDGTAESAQNPTISTDVNGANTYIAWSAQESGQAHIYVNKFNSSDSKASAGDIQVDDGSRDTATDPRIVTRPSAESGEEQVNVCIVWESEDAGDKDIFFDKSEDGITWGTDIQVNDDAVTPVSQDDPRITIDSYGDIYVVWSDLRNGDRDIYVTSSIDIGSTFKTDILVNDDSGSAAQSSPSMYVSTDGAHLCIAWSDYRNDYADIYFSRNSYHDSDHSVSDPVTTSSGGTVTANGNTEINGAQVSIPSSGLEAPATVNITKVVSSPKLNGGHTKVGKVLDFGPGGTRFNSAATIKVPYTQADLSAASVSDARNLKMFYYNLKTLLWQEVSGVTVDTINQTVTANVNHFSMYGLGFTPGAAVVENVVGGIVAAAVGGGGGGGGGCFIATAAYGTPMAGDVMALCDFRDKYLLTNRFGEAFVRFYYKHSPPVAEYISQRFWAKKIVRVILRPLVDIVKDLNRDSPRRDSPK